MDRSVSELDLPGFRFHPTEEELLDFYLRRMVLGKKLNFNIIGTINLYRYDPSELPGLAKIGEREWYFFVPRDRRQSSGGRPNRTTEHGFWKATGSDRPIRSTADPKRLLGLKKTLVFYRGRAPRGSRTDWVMNEYRLPETSSSSVPPPKEQDIVLCKIYRKATSMKELEQRAAMSSSDPENGGRNEVVVIKDDVFVAQKEEEVMMKNVEEVNEISSSSSSSTPLSRPVCQLPELQVPKYNGMEQWTQVEDPLWTQLRSPWMMMDQIWSPYANLLNF